MVKHRINNTGWIWNGDENRGVERSKTKRECRTFFHLQFLDQKWSKDLEFALAKLRGLWQCLANVYNSHSHVYGLHRPICARKTRQKNQCNEASRPSLQFEFATLPPKPQPLYETKWKGKQGKCSQTNSTWYNTQGWDMKGRGGGCEVKGQGGGGGSFVSTYKRDGWNGMTIHNFSNSR